MNILAISLAYPPLAYPRSIQVARLLKHADADTALFCANEPGARHDDTIEPDAESKLYACKRVTVRKGFADSMLDRIGHRLYKPFWNRRNLAPDAYGQWRKDVLSEVDEFLQTSGFAPAAIVTFAQPFSDHLIGLALKKRLGLPWFAHFSDPWADNPFSPFDKRTRDLNLAMERSVAEAADVLAFTSQETVDLFYPKYPNELKAKAVVLPQCFDPSQFTNNPPKGRVTIRYLGNFYGNRTPEPLIQALNRIASDDPEFLEDVTFELIGPGDAERAGELSSGLPKRLFSIRPGVSYAESLDLMSASDGLLVIDAPSEKSVFLPSKLIDYIGANRPVFGITPVGTAAKLISDLGGNVADPSNQDQLVDKLVRFIDELKHRRIAQESTWGIDAVRTQFTAANVSSRFTSILETMTR